MSSPLLQKPICYGKGGQERNRCLVCVFYRDCDEVLRKGIDATVTKPYDSRMKYYDYSYITRAHEPWIKRRLRVEDMFNAVCYAYGYTSEGEVTRVFNSIPQDADFREQLKAVKAGATRWPKFVLDVGTGKGELLALFRDEGVRCHAVDPSPGSRIAVPETMLRWLNSNDLSGFYNVSALDYLIENDSEPDTVIFCEAMEHIPERELSLVLPSLIWRLRDVGGMMIVTNWFDLHPIRPDPSHWDHVTTVDDALYDRLSSYARKVLQRKWSHLVLQF